MASARGQRRGMAAIPFSVVAVRAERRYRSSSMRAPLVRPATHEEITGTLKERPRNRGFVRLYYRDVAENKSIHFAVIVTRAKNAVLRNKVKRRTREAFRASLREGHRGIYVFRVDERIATYPFNTLITDMKALLYSII